MSTWTRAQVLARTDWTEGLATLKLDAQLLPFIPGQFANLALDIGEQRVRRSYSVASAPGTPPEFYVTRVAGGALSPSLVALEPGDAVWLDTRCAGLFTLEWMPDAARELWLIATGTGVGPYISLLRSGLLLPRFERVVIVHGTRTQLELGYREELEAAARDARVSYVPSVTRENPGHGVLTGRIPELLRDGQLEAAAGLPFDAERSHFMVCGNPAMINDSIATLEQRGFRRNKRREPGHITIEKYW
jgi:ferredoxin/flavodoxin---NADP+ reductase